MKKFIKDLKQSGGHFLYQIKTATGKDMIYHRKFQALVRFIDPANAHFAALKSAEIQTCVNREEIFE